MRCPHRSNYDSDIDFAHALRDWFAGQALSGTATQPHTHPALLARSAMKIAEAAMRARVLPEYDGKMS